MVESVRVPGIGRIGESTEKLSERAPEKVESCQYRKILESMRVPGIGRMGESTEILSGRVLKKVESL